MKFVCGMQINIEVFYKLMLPFWLCIARHAQSTQNKKFAYLYKVILSLFMGMIKHSQSTKSNKFAISLQYLKKKVRDGVHFLHAYKHQNFYKLALLFLMEVPRHIKSTQNRKLVIFLQCIKKNLSELLLCSIVMQNIEILCNVLWERERCNPHKYILHKLKNPKFISPEAALQECS